MSRFTFCFVSLFFLSAGALFAGHGTIVAKYFKKPVTMTVTVAGKDRNVDLTIVSAKIDTKDVAIGYELVSKECDLPAMDLVFEPTVGKAVLMAEATSSPLKKGVKVSGVVLAETTKKLPSDSRVDKVRISIQESKSKGEKSTSAKRK